MARPRALGVALATCLAVSGWTPRADAQTVPSPFRAIEGGQEVALVWGRSWLAPGSLDLGPKPGPVLAARYLVEASGPLFFEGVATYLPTTRDVVDPRRAEGDRAIGEADARLIMLDARLGFSLTGRRTWRRTSPHLFVGGGVAHDAAGAAPLDENLLAEDAFDFGTAFTASAGAGLRFALSPSVMLRAEGSLRLWQLQTPGGFDDPDKPLESVEQSEWVGGYGVELSAGWRF